MTGAAHRGGKKGDISWEARERTESYDQCGFKARTSENMSVPFCLLSEAALDLLLISPAQTAAPAV